MLEFTVNQTLCTRCGECVADCPARIITMAAESLPAIAAEREAACYRCQHCLMICPYGAISILGVKPSSCRPLSGSFPDPERLEALIRGRRSIRRYKPENLDPQLIQRLLDVAWQAPTGKNERSVLFTVVDDREKLSRLRHEVMEALGEMARGQRFPRGMEFFGHFVTLWEEKGADILFRDAPHLLIASAPCEGASPVPDCLIALSYFELFAQANGVGTVWNGLTTWALFDILPGMRQRLGIPDSHTIGYGMSFGKPAVRFARTVQHGPARVNRVAL